jgi:hypothetical protein
VVQPTGPAVRDEELSAEDDAAFWSRVLEIARNYSTYPPGAHRVIPLLQLVAGAPSEPGGDLSGTGAPMVEKAHIL